MATPIVLPWLQLSLCPGIGPVLARRMIQHAGSAEAAVTLNGSQLSRIEGIGSVKSRSLVDGLHQAAEDAAAQLARAEQLGAGILCPESPEWPALLRPLSDAPLVLYARGGLESRDLQALGIVGSRRCSHYGREQAERFGALLGGNGFTVISGGARGIDSAAHRGALSHPHGRTIAVLGCGVDVTYPPENEALFTQIAQRGALLSEMPFGTPPNAENFPRRNRIISGLSRGILVIEAAEQSGALITARQANEDHGRTVFAMPGRVDNELSAGPHQLIRDGAILVRNLPDILEGLDPLPDEAREFVEYVGDGENETAAEVASTTEYAHDPGPRATPGLSEPQQRILKELSSDALSTDALAERASLDVAVVLRELTFLSLKGLARRVDGQSYIRAGRK